MPDAKVFSERLRELCAHAQSNSQVARDLGINRQQFARYLNGTTMPRPKLVGEIARYFNVDPGRLFQSAPISEAMSDLPDVRGVNAAMVQMMAALRHEPILDSDLPPGFYHQYKMMFKRPGRVMVALVQVTMRDGVLYYRRRTSAKLIPELFGATVRMQKHGVFFKQSGQLLMIDEDTRMGELTYHAFQTGSHFNVDIKPGLHMTCGRPGSLGARAARIVLVRLDETQSVLQAAREQRVCGLDDVPPAVREYLAQPLDLPVPIG